MADDPQDKPTEDPQSSESLSAPAKKDEEKLEAIIDKLPPEQAQHTLREFIFGIIERSGSTPKIDPEVFKIAAATVEKDNDNKFKYLTQKQSDEAAKSVRDDAFRDVQHRDHVKLLWPILIVVLIVVVGCIASGIWLAVHGYQSLGTGLITGAAFAVAGYLAGAGTSDIFKGFFK
jgi:hypothetical protein